MGMQVRVLVGLAVAVSAAALLAAAASANDSTAELRAGGLQLMRSDVIDMMSEDLFLSTQEVRVKYVYRNTSGADVTTRVAFPLPDIGWEFGEAPVDLPNPAAPNFVDFRTTVDGADIPLEVELRAVIDSGLDVTERVKAAGMPFHVTDFEAWDKLQTKMPLELAKQLRDEGVIWLDLDPDTGAVTYLRPRWTLKTTFHRMQTFPAGKDVVVEHVYKPVVGGSVGASYIYAEGEDKDAIKREYCIDAQFDAALDRMKTGGGRGDADRRAHFGLCAEDRRQLGQADRRVSSHHREGFPGPADNAVCGGVEEDRADAVRADAPGFLARAGHRDHDAAEILGRELRPSGRFLLVMRLRPDCVRSLWFADSCHGGLVSRDPEILLVPPASALPLAALCAAPLLAVPEDDEDEEFDDEDGGDEDGDEDEDFDDEDEDEEDLDDEDEDEESDDDFSDDDED